MNTKIDLSHSAEILDTAALNAEAVEQLSLNAQFTEEEAYAIQFASMQRRFDRGEKFIGVKMGFTSKAKMEQMGVHDMIWGILTDDMLIKNGSSTSFEKYIHPRAEPEICFLVKKEIDHQLSHEEIPAYIEGIAAAIEIIDSRYKNFKFSLEDVIADNCSSTGLCIGEWQDIADNISDLKMELIVDDKVVQTGNSKAILGNPWESLVAATRLASKYNLKLPVGSLIMAGAATPAVYLEKGNEVSVRVDRHGGASFSVI